MAWFKKNKKNFTPEIEELKETTEDLKEVAEDLKKTQKKLESVLENFSRDRNLNV